ncbi:hypothetical protein ACWEHT_11550 [Streptomyces sp. NPDC004646]
MSTRTAFPAPWPKGVVARYITLAAAVDPTATVDVRRVKNSGRLTGFTAECRGCPWTEPDADERLARQEAQRHAETCRGLPGPGVAQ